MVMLKNKKANITPVYDIKSNRAIHQLKKYDSRLFFVKNKN